MTRSHRIAAACGAMLLASIHCPAPTVSYADDAPPKILLMLDASGSMKDPDPSGGSKMDAAKKALTHSLDAIPANAQVGLRVYGADNDGGSSSGACTDSRLARPVAALDKSGLTSAINEFQPRGDTPIAYSLKEGAKDLGDDGKRHIILVSDGEETCSSDPCQEIRELVAGGISLQIDTVGFGVEDKARQQLSCIAEAGGGSYYDAQDAGALDSTLQHLSTRTARPYTVAGTPVHGTATKEEAPTLTAGQYTDVSKPAQPKNDDRYYRIKRQWKNSTIRVSAVSRMPGVGLMDSIVRANWSFELSTPDATTCSKSMTGAADSDKAGVMMSATMLALQRDPHKETPSSEETKCAEADELVYKVSRPSASQDKNENPFEIRVLEEPPADNADQLPAGISEIPQANSDSVTSPASGTPQAIVGGASFNDATELPSGTYSTEVIPGEKLFFKTRIDYGQQGIFSLDSLELSQASIANAPGIGESASVASDVYAPDFTKMNSSDKKSTEYFVSEKNGVAHPEPTINRVPEVRFRNRWDSPTMSDDKSQGFSMGGYYYYVLGLAPDKFLKGQPGKINFSIKVSGDAAGQPTSTISPSPNENGEDTSRYHVADPTKRLLFATGGGLVVFGCGAAIYALLRRRRRNM